MRKVAVVLLVIFLFVPTYTLLSQEENSTETPDKQVSFSDITKQAFSSDETSGEVGAATVDSTTVTSDEPWVKRKRVVTVNSEIMADEPFKLNMFSDTEYVLIPDEFEEKTVDFTVVSSDGAVYDAKHVSGTLIDGTDNEVGTGSMTSVNKDSETSYTGRFKLDGGKLYEVNTDEDLTTELTEYKDNQYVFNCPAIIRELTVSIAGGSGRVESKPEGITCSSADGSDCSEKYKNDTTVTLEALLPPTGLEFSHWSGDCSGSDNPITITMDADKTCTANFKVPTVRLRITRKGYGTIEISSTSGHPDGMECRNCTLMGTSAELGSVVTITATPDEGYTFSHWSGSKCLGTDSEDNPLEITMDGNKSCKANFSSNE